MGYLSKVFQGHNNVSGRSKVLDVLLFLPSKSTTLFTRIKRVLGIEPKPKPSSRDKLLEMVPNNAICAEIGAWKGDFSERILKETSPKKLHLIDPWEFQTDFGERLFGGKVAKSQGDMDSIFDDVKKRFTSYGDLVQFHRAFSDAAASDFKDEYFDWIYVDGNHYYDFVLNDLKHYYPKVKVGGWLCGDDYQWTSPELNGDLPVKRAVADFLKEYADRVEEVVIMGGQYILKRIK